MLPTDTTIIELAYYLDKNIDIEEKDKALAEYMQKYKGDWVASDYGYTYRFFLFKTAERYNRYVVKNEDVSRVIEFLPARYYVKWQHPWPYMHV